MTNKDLFELIDHKQKLVDINLNVGKLSQGRESSLADCLSGNCVHEKVISVNNVIELNEKDYSIKRIILNDDENIDVCLTCLNILSPLNDILYFNTLINPNEIILSPVDSVTSL